MNRLALPAFATIALLALAGCASASSVTLEQEGLANASGKDRKTLDCPSGEGKVTYTVDGTAGKIKIQVDDANEEGPRPMDKDEIQGKATGEVGDLVGDAGTWTLTVDRSDFTGDYKVTLTC